MSSQQHSDRVVSVHTLNSVGDRLKIDTESLNITL